MAAKKRKKIIQFSEFSSEPVDWIWPGWIAAGKVTLVDGDPGEGKSVLTLHSFVGQSAEGAWDRLPVFPEDRDLLQETIGRDLHPPGEMVTL